MRPFSGKWRSRTESIIPADLVVQLPEIGWAVFHDCEPAVDVSGFYLPGFVAAGSPPPGSNSWDTFTNELLEELLAAATTTGEWGIAGAFYVAKDFVASEDHAKPLFVEIVDRALVFMAGAGVSTAMLPMFALGRWEAIQRARS